MKKIINWFKYRNCNGWGINPIINKKVNPKFCCAHCLSLNCSKNVVINDLV